MNATEQDSPATTAPECAETPIAAGIALSGRAGATATKPESTAWAVHVWRRLLREPSLLVTLAYLFVSFIGLWSNYFFYRGFDLPILEYMQASDYLVAGLRDPAYALLLVSSLALVLVITWPETYRRRYPERAEAYRRRWWGRVVFANLRGWSWKGVGLAPETGVVLAVFWGMVWASAAYVANKAQTIREGEAGNIVRVTLAGDVSPQPRAARLLGSTSAFVMLWWPEERVAEAIPIESIARLQSIGRKGAHAEARGDAASNPVPVTPLAR